MWAPWKGFGSVAILFAFVAILIGCSKNDPANDPSCEVENCATCVEGDPSRCETCSDSSYNLILFECVWAGSVQCTMAQGGTFDVTKLYTQATTGSGESTKYTYTSCDTYQGIHSI